MSRGQHNETCNEDAAAVYLLTIAGSAGALTALRQLISLLPIDFPGAVAAMLHVGADSQLTDVLQLGSAMPVHAAISGELLRAGHVYVAPGGHHLVVNPDARVSLSCAPRVRHFRPSADWLFESAAASYRERHIAVILGGILTDGAQALAYVKRTGGTVLVQDPDECTWSEMPRAAIATGLVTAVLPLLQMAAAIEHVFSRRSQERDLATWDDPFERALAG